VCSAVARSLHGRARAGDPRLANGAGHGTARSVDYGVPRARPAIAGRAQLRACLVVAHALDTTLVDKCGGATGSWDLTRAALVLEDLRLSPMLARILRPFPFGLRAALSVQSCATVRGAHRCAGVTALRRATLVEDAQERLSSDSLDGAGLGISASGLHGFHREVVASAALVVHLDVDFALRTEVALLSKSRRLRRNVERGRVDGGETQKDPAQEEVAHVVAALECGGVFAENAEDFSWDVRRPQRIGLCVGFALAPQRRLARKPPAKTPSR